MRASAAFAKALPQLGFKSRRNRVFETFRLFMDLVPFHAEDFAEHAFDEMVAKGGPVGGLAPARR